MRNKEYWKRRMEILEESQMRKGERFFTDLQRQYKNAEREIEKEISKWYQRFADNNEITLVEAKKLLNTRELQEFRWDVNDYIQFGKENALDQRWMKQLENASARVHISRLESIQIQIQQHVEVLFGNRLDEFDKVMKDIYREGYYRTAFEIQRGFRIGWDLRSIDENQLDKIISRPWRKDGSTFSDSIWNNKQKLINDLQTELTQSVTMGRSPRKSIAEIKKLIGAGIKPRQATYRAGRLVMTESAAFSSIAQRDMYRELDLEQYEYLATLDNRTSEICQQMDGKVFRMEDYEVGVTAPVLHAWCRSTTIPYFQDFTESEQRIARGANGKTYMVPGDMTYKEWQKTFVAGGPKTGLKERE